jgi:GT2 family glycosyltransferase
MSKLAFTKILLILVHHKSKGLILEMLDGIRRLNLGPEMQICVVDNSSGAEEIADLKAKLDTFANAKLLETSNLGYFGAARFALQRFLEQGSGLPEWVIVSNHDVLVEDKDFLTKLIREDHNSVGVIAPRIQILPSRRDQNPFMRVRPNRLRWAQLQLTSSSYLLASVWDWLWRRKSRLLSWLSARIRRSTQNLKVQRELIYAPHGAFVIFSRRYFEAGGFLDDNLFLYGEELSVGEICRSLHLPVVYVPSIAVVHTEHQSTGKSLSRFTYECQKKAIHYVNARYFSTSKRSVSREPGFLN